MPRSCVELVALDEQEGRNSLVTDLPYLLPKTSASQRAMEIGNRLALHQDASADAVITRSERFDRDARPKPLKNRGNATPTLEHINRNKRNGIALIRDARQRHSRI